MGQRTQTKVCEFKGRYSFLSNFHPCAVRYKGEIYNSAEHAYQVAKCKHESDRLKIQKAATASAAKKLGAKVAIVENWMEIRVKVMFEILWNKFSHPILRDELLATGNVYLEEGNWWGDRFWGVYNDEGENWLGVILMIIRDKLRKKLDTPA